MRRTGIVLGGLLCSSCGDVGTDGATDVDEPRSIAAPFVLEPARERLVLHDAVIDGRALGDVALQGPAIEAVAGELDGVPMDGEPVRGTAVALRSELRTSGAFVDADAIGLELVGVDAAWQGDGTLLALDEHAHIDASGFSWDDPGSVLVLLEEEDPASTASAARATYAGRRLARLELAHTFGLDDDESLAPALALLDDEAPQLLAVGEVCTMTEECDAGLFCAQDPMAYPDAQDRCVAMCVPATPSMPLTCADDDACCDPDATCNDDGVCVAPTVTGSGGNADGCNDGPCDDRDGDGVVNSVDQNPDQSCSADADSDGCKDSCDGDDTDGGCGGGGTDGNGGGGFCSTHRRFPRPNTTMMAFVVLILLRGRSRRAISAPSRS